MSTRKRSGADASSSPVRKRSRLSRCDEKMRTHILQQKHKALLTLRSQYHDNLAELSFLQAGSQLVDYYSWRHSRPEQLCDVLRTGALDDEDLEVVNKYATGNNDTTDFFPLPVMAAQNYTISSDFATSSDSTKDDVVRFISIKTLGSDLDRNGIDASESQRVLSLDGDQSNSVIENGNLEPLNEDSESAQREIVEKARQEATAMQRVAQLRKEGLWSARRLPKVSEPPRRKAHWDYVLEEMQWLAVDFMQERKWKKAAARKVAFAIQKKFREREENERRAERDEINRKKRIASSMARMVREWWQNIDKLVQYKQKTRLDEMRKKALDVHLNFIVDQTERFSEWLTEGMHIGASGKSDASSGVGSQSDATDDDFNPDTVHLESEDDEETIARAEEEENNSTDVNDELDILRQEGEIPMEELLNSLPPKMLSRTGESDTSCRSSDTSESADEMSVDEDSKDDERTLDEQEGHEDENDTKVDEEIAALEEEADLPLEDLLSKYGGIEATKHVVEDSSESEQSEDDKESESDEFSIDNESVKESSSDETEKAEDSTGMSWEEMEDSDEEDKDDANDADVSLAALLPKTSEAKKNSGPASEAPPSEASTIAAEGNVSEVERNFNALAAEAESLQPTGYTLESTRINVPVPFLLKHTLREYQHVGLDWLATMYDKRLNGILADEMGLGKTIQTIALLAHLATDKGVWGPHLIVVPTSVMLNWELEFKKWCPSFKILTYFGSQKERKEKRKGWTKTNAFHVCITSYKLAIQDHNVFKRKKWKYLVLDEAQNIKNFKSKRWQTLLTFNSQRRLLLTGTPLQNSLMELWSLMHFLMPHVFQSHREFREWFANPLTGMIEGSQEYNEFIVLRLHKVLRPFLLRRLKKDVEKQMPQKYEHVVMCRLSRRQRYLYDDFMSRSSTQNSLTSGHFMSVINILMQLRKVCNHPNLFEPRPTVSPFKTEGIQYSVPSLVLNALDYEPLKEVDIRLLFPNLVEMENDLSSFVAHRVKQLQPPRRLIEEIDSVESIPSKDPYGVGNPANMPSTSKPFIPREVLKKLRAEQSTQSGQDPRLGPNKNPLGGVPQATPLEQLPGYLPIHRRAQATRTPDWCQSYRITNSSTTPPHWENLPSGTLAERRSLRKSQLQLIAVLNERRCELSPVYGSNVINRLSFVGQQPVRPLGRVVSLRKATFLCRGYHNTYWAQCQRERTRGRMHWCGCTPLEAIVNRPEDHVRQLDEVIDRFVFCIPTVWSPGVKISAPHLPGPFLNWERTEEPQIRRELSPKFQILNTISRRQSVRFPEARLIQYDCGKLQTLDPLLRKLKRETHRALIFTQMTRMLDVLEQFLSYHGHTYLRLDGTTKVEQRQALMDRFNADNRIFCFILSTRSGGLGINLTGADTVIFYDSDWNPTMDAQAQDRCHRIGQTRDVHIYRLISEKTIEENILKKANQKRFLSDVAIEGGRFTTAHFRQNTLRELFEEPSGLEDFVREKNASSAESAGPSDGEVGPTATSSEPVDTETVERCLEECEDDSDRIAAGRAREEAKAELAEFDETIPWDEQEAANQAQSADQVSRVELELRALENELSSIERFAIRAIETNQGGHLEDELNEAETRIEEAKRNWELEHAKALRDAEEMRAEEEEDDMLYCYGAYDLSNQVRELERIKREEWEAEKREKEVVRREEARVEALRVAKQVQINELAAAGANAAASIGNSPAKRSGGKTKNMSTSPHVPLSDDDESRKSLNARKRPRPANHVPRNDVDVSPGKFDKEFIQRKQMMPDNRIRPISSRDISLPSTSQAVCAPQVQGSAARAAPRPADGRVPIPRLPRPASQVSQPQRPVHSHVQTPVRNVTSSQPQIAVQLVPNGHNLPQKAHIPLNTLLLNSQPVTVVTRQIVAPNGQVFQQRFVQPVPNSSHVQPQPQQAHIPQINQIQPSVYSSASLMQSINRFNAAVSSAQVMQQPAVTPHVHQVRTPTVVGVTPQPMVTSPSTVFIAPRVQAQTVVVPQNRLQMLNQQAVGRIMLRPQASTGQPTTTQTSHVVKILPAPVQNARNLVQPNVASNAITNNIPVANIRRQ